MKYLIPIFLFSVTLGIAQASKKEVSIPKNMELITVYHDNGEISQMGYLKNNLLEGTWGSFDTQGAKQSSGIYKKGRKTGKWLFWQKTILVEVHYDANEIKKVVEWNLENETLVSR